MISVASGIDMGNGNPSPLKIMHTSAISHCVEAEEPEADMGTILLPDPQETQAKI